MHKIIHQDPFSVRDGFLGNSITLVYHYRCTTASEDRSWWIMNWLCWCTQFPMPFFTKPSTPVIQFSLSNDFSIVSWFIGCGLSLPSIPIFLFPANVTPWLVLKSPSAFGKLIQILNPLPKYTDASPTQITKCISTSATIQKYLINKLANTLIIQYFSNIGITSLFDKWQVW